jgi:chromosome segregation ATPase
MTHVVDPSTPAAGERPEIEDREAAAIVPLRVVRGTPEGAESAQVERPQLRSSPTERELFRLEERIAELELLLAARSSRDEIFEVEFRSLQLDVAVKRGYIAMLESNNATLQGSFYEVATDNVALRSSRDTRERQLDEANATIAAIRARRAYRLAAFAASIVLLPIRIPRALIRRVRRSV